MGRKPLKKAHHNIFVLLKTEEEIEDMKCIYYIQGKPILALNEKIANEIYMRNYNKSTEE